MDVNAATAQLRDLREARAKLKRERVLREERKLQQNLDGGLLAFVRYFWHILEPSTPFVEGWVLECLCGHLEAITRKETVILKGEERRLNRLLANVPPGFMKSLLVNVFWPAWEWGPAGLPHLRYVCFSYGSELTERDNAKFRDLIMSPAYQEMWGHVFKVTRDGQIRVTNDKMGFKFATSKDGVGTGERGDRVLLDDPHKIKGTKESDEARQSTVTWVREGMQNRLNNLEESVIVIIMQRVHQDDTSQAIIDEYADEYCIFQVPMEFEPGRHFTHLAGWADPRVYDGELAWPERYGERVLRSYRRQPYLWAGQYQQRPSPRGGGLLKEDFWQPYEVPPSMMYDIVPIFTLAALDTAYKEKEENDFNALTVWTVYDDAKTGDRRVMLTDAWKKKLPLHGKRVDRHPDETENAYVMRASKHWGLLEWVNFTCSRRHVNRLIIEDASRGHDVQAEIRRVYRSRNWRTVLVKPVGDKWDRVQSVVDIFADEMVYVPGGFVCSGHGKSHCQKCPPTNDWQWRDWAQMVIEDCSAFPRGAHDDVVDTVAMALKHLRQCNYLVRRDERALAEKLLAAHQKPLPAIYPV